MINVTALPLPLSFFLSLALNQGDWLSLLNRSNPHRRHFIASQVHIHHAFANDRSHRLASCSSFLRPVYYRSLWLAQKTITESC